MTHESNRSSPLLARPLLARRLLARRRLIKIFAALPILPLAAGKRARAALAPGAVTGMIDLIGFQNMMVQKIFKEMLLVALGVDRQEHLQALRRSRESFERALANLRHDRALKPLLDDSAVRAHRAKMADLWPPFDDMILSGITAGQVSHNLVDALVELDPLLSGTASATLSHLVERAVADTRSAGLARSLSTAARQRTLTQSMAKEFLLVAYHYETEANRTRLLASYRTFEGTLNAMIDGNAEQRLIPAPTDEIRNKLRDLGGVWRRQAAIMRIVAEGGQPARNTIAEAARHNAGLLRGMEEVFALYAQL